MSTMTQAKYEAELRWWQTDAAKRSSAILYREAVDYYSTHLQLDKSHNCGRLLDVGCGPILPASHLTYDELWCVDPLLEQYRSAELLVHVPGVVLVNCRCEEMWPLPDNFFDTVVSVNALDHVDDFERSIAEVERVAKPDADISIRLSYHAPTLTEPQELNDDRVAAAFKRHNPWRFVDEDKYGQVLWTIRNS